MKQEGPINHGDGEGDTSGEELRHALDRIVQLEDRLAASDAALASFRKEFKDFSHSLSHDLRAPIRAASGFSRALLEDCSASLDDHGQDYLHRVITSMAHATELLDQIVQFAKLSMVEIQLEKVDLSSMAHTLSIDLQKRQPNRLVQTQIESGLFVKGDRACMNALLEKLLNNAWKYSAHQAESTIQVKRLPREDFGNMVHISIQDNGSGFDPLFKDKLFQPLQRLHNPNDFPIGTGMGLAIARKVVERHGGQIDGESIIGKGSCFTFSLPAPL